MFRILSILIDWVVRIVSFEMVIEQFTSGSEFKDI